MKKWIILLILGAMGCTLAAKDLSILMIGNSFSICVGRNLPQIVHSVPGHHLKLTSAYIGGCPLEKHWNNILAAEKNPDADLYKISVWDSNDPAKENITRGNVAQLLKNNTYDIITIQQASPRSWDYDTYQPFAADLIAYIRKHNPKAEIVVQQTWSYRRDEARLLPGDKYWGFGQTEMAKRAADAYRKLAATGPFRVIPTGDAVQIARELEPGDYKVLTEEERNALKEPALPDQSGDVVGKDYWGIDQKTGKKVLRADRIHLNPKGDYLQACVWFCILFGESTDKIAYDNPNFDAAYNKFLRDCAQKAVDNYKQLPGL